MPCSLVTQGTPETTLSIAEGNRFFVFFKCITDIQLF